LKVIFASVLLVSFAFSSAMAHAVGVVLGTEEAHPVLEEQAGTFGGILPLVLVGTALCVALCGGGDDQRPRQMQG
jgi:hypothetical protein